MLTLSYLGASIPTRVQEIHAGSTAMLFRFPFLTTIAHFPVIVLLHIGLHALMHRLLQTASTFINLDYKLSRGTIGDALTALLGEISVDGEPDWCPPDSMARERKMIVSPARHFFYQPHTFPDMDPLLANAHRLQHALLPGSAPKSTDFTVIAVLESFCHLSGDIFGWHAPDEDTLRIWLLDMSGHGLHAGLLAALLTIIMEEVRSLPDISDQFESLNRTLHDCLFASGDVLYATGTLLELRTGSLRYVSAAHPALLLRFPDGSVSALPAEGRPLGVFADSHYPAKEEKFKPGQALLLCTDGMIEVGNMQGREFGLSRLMSTFAESPPPAQAIAEHLYISISHFQDMNLIDDDMTFLVVEYR